MNAEENNGLYQIHVYELHHRKNTSTPKKSHLVSHLVSTSRESSGNWEVFNIGHALALEESLNSLYDSKNRAEIELSVEATTTNGKPLKLSPETGRHSKQPFLVLYNMDEVSTRSKRSTSSEIQYLNSSSTTTESSSSHSSSEATGITSTIPLITDEPNTLPAPTESPPQPEDHVKTMPCQRLPLYVDFELIGLENIISPRGYQAYWCHGSCSYPLGQEVSPSNHATVQSFAHHVGLKSSYGPKPSELQNEEAEEIGEITRYAQLENIPVTAPCCVPSGLLSVSILF
ncbi:unnamed protein product, partial [Notodromas monacha]